MILWIIFIAIEVARNYYLIEVKKSRPIYIQSFLIRGIAAILHGVYFDVQSMTEYVPIFIFQILSFWWLFDISLNLVRGLSIIYKGDNSGWLDSIPTRYYWALKISVTVFGIWLYSTL
jgi:hypothetical protein